MKDRNCFVGGESLERVHHFTLADHGLGLKSFANLGDALGINAGNFLF